MEKNGYSRNCFFLWNYLFFPRPRLSVTLSKMTELSRIPTPDTGSWQSLSPGDPEPHGHRTFLIPRGGYRLVWPEEILDTRGGWMPPINDVGIKTNIWIWRVSGLPTVTVIPRNLGSVSGAIREITDLWVWDETASMCPGGDNSREPENRRPGGLVSPDTGGFKIYSKVAFNF